MQHYSITFVGGFAGVGFVILSLMKDFQPKALGTMVSIRTRIRILIEAQRPKFLGPPYYDFPIRNVLKAQGVLTFPRRHIATDVLGDRPPALRCSKQHPGSPPKWRTLLTVEGSRGPGLGLMVVGLGVEGLAAEGLSL